MGQPKRLFPNRNERRLEKGNALLGKGEFRNPLKLKTKFRGIYYMHEDAHSGDPCNNSKVRHVVTHLDCSKGQ